MKRATSNSNEDPGLTYTSEEKLLLALAKAFGMELQLSSKPRAVLLSRAPVKSSSQDLLELTSHSKINNAPPETTAVLLIADT